MVGPFKSARGKMTHILVMVDKFTKWIEVKPISKCDGHTAVKFLKDIILRYGVPHGIAGTWVMAPEDSLCVVNDQPVGNPKRKV
jgi:hypothetical protein